MTDPSDMIKSKQFIKNLLSNIPEEEEEGGSIDAVSYLMNYRTIEIKTPRQFERNTYIADCLNEDDENIAIVVNDVIREWMINMHGVNPDQIFTSDKFIEDNSFTVEDMNGNIYIDKCVFESVSNVDRSVIYAIIDDIVGLDATIIVI